MITAIVGRNASGKTQYVEQMRRNIASDTLRYVAFRDSYGSIADGAYYLQQRWNQHDIDPETPMVNGQPLISLSSGELRRYQLRKALASHPKTLILDNPFIGLDAETRQQLRTHLLHIANEESLDLYLVIAKTDDLPDYVEQVIDMDNDGKTMTLKEYLAQLPELPAHVLNHEKRQAIIDLPTNMNDYHAEEVVCMHDVSIRYGERTILKDLSWTVRNGERWALSGQNGSGKSTLLSLVCADNPQAYACDITLFGYRRGQSGETIWDIKRHIGYVSPEMHRSYHRNLPAIHIVASGLKDTVGLYVRPNEQELKQCQFWMSIFGIENLANRSFITLSSGEQRLVLLARAFVKDPELLILDEPLHGLDLVNRRLAKDIIEAFCERKNKTLIFVTHYQEELPLCITNHLELHYSRSM
ncbi:MAG: ATP-binding cassette domain-containing protein [Prevotella sp.]|nr:ATP-binding cassette domain-containing protein [Prevotella sp.]